MNKYKITENEINENNVKSAADLLKGEPRDNKNIFDRLPELIATKLNGFIDAIISKFTDYYNKGEIDSKESVLDEAINTKANDADVYKKTETYTKNEVDSKETALSNRINAKANSADVYAKSETYTKAETDTKLDAKANASDVYTKAQTYTKNEVNSKESSLSDRINAKANSADVYLKSETYTKTEADTKLNAKANASDVYTKAQTYTKEETNVAINEKVAELGAGDMAKAVYDADNDGIVDNAERLGGQLPAYYASTKDVEKINWFDKGDSLGSGKDLNTLTAVGMYYAVNGDIAATLVNAPTKENFKMYVYERTNNTKGQLIFGRSTVHVRGTNSSGTWSNWSTLATTTAVQTAQTAANNAVKKAGDTMTGALTLSGDPTEDLHAVTKQYVDATLLWENADINDSFDAQDITVDTSYPKLHIVFRVSLIEGMDMVYTTMLTDGESYRLTVPIQEYTSTARTCLVEEENKLFIGNCWQDGAKDNTWMIPYRIYGVR